MTGDINLFLALGAGFLSFISPCLLPLYPAFLSYITGMSVAELKEENAMFRRRSMIAYSVFPHRIFIHIHCTWVWIHFRRPIFQRLSGTDQASGCNIYRSLWISDCRRVYTRILYERTPFRI